MAERKKPTTPRAKKEKIVDEIDEVLEELKRALGKGSAEKED